MVRFSPPKLRIILLLCMLCLTSLGHSAEAPAAAGSFLPWWGWSLILLVFTFLLGIIAVLGGVGGGVLFVPIVSGFFPFHLDFVRAAGLIVAVAGALAAGPSLLRKGLAYLRIALPVALLSSISSIFGSLVGLALPANVLQLCLGITIMGILAVMLLAKQSYYPNHKDQDALSCFLGLSCAYFDQGERRRVEWCVHNTLPALALFLGIGFLAGLFGLGAGWANVPVLNLVMGLPLKVAAATSNFILSVTDSTAAWIYVQSGAALPVIIVPSVVGMMAGARIGAGLLTNTKPKTVRDVVLAMLFAAGIRAILKGVGI